MNIYKCNVCGNVVEVVDSGMGTLVCCGKPMELLEEKHEDVGNEKHVPVMQRTNDGKGIIVKVGSVPHPMEENHYIQWIELIYDGRTYRKFLTPNDKPEAKFDAIDFNSKSLDKPNEFKVRIYCNLHGLWKN